MKNYIKDIYLLIIFLFAAMACSDNEELIKKDEPGEVIPPVVVEPVTVLDEHFDDKNKYLTSGGQPFPSFFSNGYFERAVSDEVIQGLSLKVFLTQCQLEPDAPGVSVNGTTTSDGRILLDANTGAIETGLLGSVSKVSLVAANASANNTGTKVVLMIKAKGGNWEVYAKSPVLSGTNAYEWVLDRKIMKYPIYVKVVADEAASSTALAIYDFSLEGTLCESPVDPGPSPENTLFNEGFYNDGEGIKIFKASDGSAFPGGTWNTKDGHFERTIGEQTLKVQLHGCRIDYTENRISIYGESTSKGRLQIGTGGGYIEFPVLGSISKISLALSAGTAGDVATRALIQYRDKGTTDWKDLAMSEDITANSPMKWVLNDVSANPVAIRIMQDPAITKGNSLAIYDLVIEGVTDLLPEEAVDVTLMDERFRDLAIYVVTETGQAPDRYTFYEKLHYDRVVEGRTLRTKIYQGRVQNTTQPPANANGATQGRLLLKNFADGGALETPIFGRVKSIVVKIIAADTGQKSKAILQTKGVGDEEWTDYAVTDEVDETTVLSWELENVSDEPVALRIIQHPDYTHNMGIYNLTIEGTLY